MTKRISVTIAALALISLASSLTADRWPVARAVVEIVIAPGQEPPAAYGVARLREALEARGFRATEGSAIGGRIPSSFIDSKWDLMYFVEVMDTNGRGRMYPDLEKETPYVVVSARR